MRKLHSTLGVTRSALWVLEQVLEPLQVVAGSAVTKRSGLGEVSVGLLLIS